MTDIPATPVNPVPLGPGPDLHIRTFLHSAVERHMESGGEFNVEDWSAWSEAEVAAAIRALANDYLDTAGEGYDWISAAHQAEFVMAATYHDVAHHAGLSPAPPLRVNFFDPAMGEGIEVEMAPPSGVAMDPVPGVAPLPPSENSYRARTRLEVVPPGNCLNAQDRALWTGAQQLSEFFQTHSRLPLMMMGAVFTLWKALQVAHTARAGIIFRGIRNPARPDIPTGEMRLVYSRTGDHLMGAVAADPDGASLLLV